MFQIQKAKREQLKGSIVCEGLQGSGKSVAALMLAYALAEGELADGQNVDDLVGAVDTENRSLNLLVGRTFDGCKIGEFMKIDFNDNFSPQNFKLAQEALIKAGAKAIVIDSYTHMWAREGGVLDTVSAAQANQSNKYTAWGKDEVREGKELVFRLIRNPHAHIIGTVRLKEKQEIADGKIISLGEQQIMQDGFKYEPDLVLRFTGNGNYEVMKSRYELFPVGETGVLTMELCRNLAAYLQEGIDPNELLEKQRLDMLHSLQETVQTNGTAQMLFNTLMNSEHPGVKASELSLDVLKTIYYKVMNAIR